MGVVTVNDIDYGQIFGPFPRHLSAPDPVYVISMLTNDKPEDEITVQVDTEERQDGLKVVDWLPYVSPARDEDEQNMEAYLKDGQVYYRTLRIVKAGEELLVWYSKDFTQVLGIPKVATNSKREDEQFICTHCGEMFDFPYPLRAHLKFKCSFTTNATTRALVSDQAKLNNQRQSPCDNITSHVLSERLQDKSQSVLNYMTNNNAMFAISSKRLLNEDMECEIKAKRFLSENKSKNNSRIFHSIEELVSTKTENRINKKEINTYSDTGSAFRKVEKSQNLSPSNRTSPKSFFASVSTKTSPQSGDSSPQPVVARSSSVLLGSHIFPVHKSQQSFLSIQNEQALTASLPLPALSSVKQYISAVTPMSSSNSSLPPAPVIGLYMPRVPLIASASSLSNSNSARNHLSAGTSSNRVVPAPHSAFPDQIPPGLLEMCRATIPTIGPLTESFAANIRNSKTLAKQALFADRHISTLGFLKSTNPMVEKLLQSTNPTLLSSPINAMNLSQNWCAKCNATFRMTSDLVYHMRSHHKREFDPMKRRREEKLKCNICNETFRERHHLTRHMSSHA